MSRRRTDLQDIKNTEHYSKRYVALETLKERIRQKEYDSFFCSLDSKLSDHFPDIQSSLAVNSDEAKMEELLVARDPLSWIDYIEFPALHQALSGLPKQQQLLLTYRYYFCLTQCETAKLMGCNQSTVQRCEKRLIRKLKKSLEI